MRYMIMIHMIHNDTIMISCIENSLFLYRKFPQSRGQRAPASPSGKDHPVRWERQTRVAPRPPPPGSEYSDYQYYMRARENAV